MTAIKNSTQDLSDKLESNKAFNFFMYGTAPLLKTIGKSVDDFNRPLDPSVSQ
jgi:hypothetical protein